MKSLEAIRIAKLGSKKKFHSDESTYTGGSLDGIKTPTANTGELADFRGIKDGIKDSGPSGKAGNSMEILKAHKAGGVGKMPTAKTGPMGADLEGIKTIESGESPLLKTKTTPYSPIQNYLKRGK